MTATPADPKLLNYTLESVGEYTLGVRKNTYFQNRTTVVLAHGIGVSSRYYIPLIKQLAQKYNVIALDLPGYGNAPKPPVPLTVKQLAVITHAFLKKNSIKEVVAIGQSMGCQIIAHLPAIDATSVSKIILLSPTVNRNERTLFKQGLRLAQNSLFEAPVVNKIIFTDYLKMGMSRYLQTSRYMIEDHIEETLATNFIPTLIILGEKDPIVPNEWGSYLESINSFHSLAVIPNAPHAFQYKFANETARICQNFIEQ